MLALYIILGIILFVFIILHFPVVANIDFSNRKLVLRIKYLFFTLYPLRKKKKRKLSKRKRRKLEKELEDEKKQYNSLLEKCHSSDKSNGNNTSAESKNDTSDLSGSTPKKEKEEKLFDKLKKYKDKWQDIKPYVPIGKKAVKKLIKAIKITDFDFYLAVADEDAYECAMKYGKVNAAFYNILALVKQFFTLKIKKIRIESKFNSSETEYAVRCSIKTRPSTLIAIFMCILVKYMYTNVKIKKQKENKNETEMRENG